MRTDKNSACTAPDPHHSASEMLVENLKSILRNADELSRLIDADQQYEGWIDDKLSQAALHLNEIHDYLANHQTQEPVMMLMPAAKDPLLSAARALREAAKALDR